MFITSVDVSLATEAIVNGGIYLFKTAVRSYVAIVTAVLLGIFEVYADLAVTLFNVVRNSLLINTQFGFLLKPFAVIGAYLFIFPAGTVSAIYAFFLVFVRPLLEQPFDFNVPIPDKPSTDLTKDGNFGQHRYEQLKDIKLHYVIKLPKDKEGNVSNDYKYLIVFLHGFAGFWYSWRNQIEYFSTLSEFGVVAVDLRGCGQSEKPFSKCSYQLQYLIEDLRELLEKINPDNKEVILVGHSWGGIITYEFMLHYCSRVHKYVTIGAPAHYDLQITTKQIIQLWYAYFYQLPYLPELFLKSTNLKFFDKLYKSSYEHVIKAYKYTYGKSGSFSYPLNYYRANFVKLFEYVLYGSKYVVTIDKPGLAIYGDKDNIIDREVYKGGYNVPMLTVKELHGDHYLHEDPYSTDILNRVILRFVDQKIKLPNEEEFEFHADKLTLQPFH